MCVYVSDKMLRLVLINSRMRQGTRGCGLRRALSQIMINNLYFNVPGQLEPVQPAASLALHGRRARVHETREGTLLSA